MVECIEKKVLERLVKEWLLVYCGSRLPLRLQWEHVSFIFRRQIVIFILDEQFKKLF